MGPGSGELAQQLRAHALAEDTSSIPNTKLTWLTPAGEDPSFLASKGTFPHMRPLTHRHIFKNKNTLTKKKVKMLALITAP